MRCPSRSQLRAPLSAWAATVRVHLPPLLLPMIHHWLWPTRTAHLYEHVEVCVALLFLRSVAGGWRVLDAGAGLRELRVAGSGYRFVPTPVSGALVLDFILPISRVRVHSA